MGGCCKGEPGICCGGTDEGGRPTNPDECACGCFCLNGPGQISGAMILTFVGFLFTVISLGDCAFAEIEFNDECVLPDDERYIDIPNFISPTDRVGFITFSKPNGNCYWYDSGYNAEDQIRAYFDFLGSDWVLGRGFLIFVSAAACLLLMYMFWFICTAQFKGLRYMIGCVLIIGLTLFQCLSFLVFGDQFCSKCNCTFGRSAGFGVGAAVCYFMAGVAFFFTVDYPGKARLASMQDKSDDQAAAAAAAAAVSKKDEPIDDEEQAPGEGGGGDDDDEPEMDVEMGEDEENPGEEEPTASAKAMAVEEEEPAASGDDEAGIDEEKGESEVVGVEEEEPAAASKQENAADEETGEASKDEEEPPVEAEATVIEEEENDAIPPSSTTEMMSGKVVDDEVVVAETETGEAEVVFAADAETGETEVVMAAGPNEETGEVNTSTAPEDSFHSAVGTAPPDNENSVDVVKASSETGSVTEDA